MTPAVNFDPLEPAELKPIVDAWGGVEPFARLIHAKERTVESWLNNERRVKPTIALLIRMLGFPPNKKSREIPGPKPQTSI